MPPLTAQGVHMQLDMISLLLVIAGGSVIMWSAENTRRALAEKGGEDSVINALSWPYRLLLRAAGRDAGPGGRG
ncbi:hypothetical protein GCM10011505_30220 [Tistrella bauzanensis]|uniref:Uncharacterized protein n=2 Tax=Tistrella TaxID=171436 RepID=A0ABQ1IP33_9PROT|nr:hypothetical protein GCM10011505_30220 [Tistrella bauzanensis]